MALEMVRQLNGVGAYPSLHAASRAARELTGVEGFEPPTWDALANGLRHPTHDADEFEPGAKRGWQHEAASRVERQFRIRLMERMAEHEQALLRSRGPMAGMALTASPSSFSTRIDPHLFRVILLRHLRLSLPLSVRQCRCGRSLLWPSSSCVRENWGSGKTGIRHRYRGFTRVSGRRRQGCNQRAVERLGSDRASCPGRTPIGDGLPLFGGVQLAVDATLVSPLHCDGTARPGSARVDGAALAVARRRKECTHPELVGRQARARLVVLAGEVGGRWSVETSTFV